MFTYFNKKRRDMRLAIKEAKQFEDDYRNGRIPYIEYVSNNSQVPKEPREYIEYFLAKAETFSDSKFSNQYVSSNSRISLYDRLLDDITKLPETLKEPRKKFFEDLQVLIDKDYLCRLHYYKDDEDAKYLFKYIFNVKSSTPSIDLLTDEKYNEACALYELFMKDGIKGEYKRYLNFIGEPYINISYDPDWDGINNGDSPYSGSFTIDFNSVFAEKLSKCNIDGKEDIEDSEELVNKWFSNVCVMLAVAFIQDENDPDSYQSLLSDDPATTIVEKLEINESDFDSEEDYTKAKELFDNRRKYR